MPKIARCKDTGLNCEFIFRGETEDELLENAKEHAIAVHPSEWEQSPLKGLGADFMAGAGGGTVIGPSAKARENWLATVSGAIQNE